MWSSRLIVVVNSVVIVEIVLILLLSIPYYPTITITITFCLSPTEHNSLASGLQARARTGDICSFSVLNMFPSSDMSHTCMGGRIVIVVYVVKIWLGWL